MKTIIFHQGAFGDWILVFPILRALAGRKLAVTHWSKARLASRMIEGVEPVDVELREFSRLYSPGGPAMLSRQVEEYFEQLDCVISFVSDGNDAWSENIRKLLPNARTAFVTPRPPEDWSDHVSNWYLARLRKQGIDLADPPMPARREGGTCIALHPGSGGQEKCWPVKRFRTVIDTLQAAGKAVLVLLGEVELETWDDKILRQFTDNYETRACLSVESLHRALEDASMFIGNDTGPSHLAAQMGLPTVVLFGPTEAALWRPIGPDVRLLAPPKPQPMEWLSPEAVIEACALTR